MIRRRGTAENVLGMGGEPPARTPRWAARAQGRSFRPCPAAPALDAGTQSVPA